jgi:hypothetical protein
MGAADAPVGAYRHGYKGRVTTLNAPLPSADLTKLWGKVAWLYHALPL